MNSPFENHSAAGIRQAMSDHMDNTVSSLQRSLDGVEDYTTSVFQLLREKLRILYQSSVEWANSFDHGEKFSVLKETIISRSNDILAILRSHELHIKINMCMDSLKGLMYTDVSKQALIFGCGGLLTGAIIGVCFGRKVRHGPLYGPLSNGGSNSYIMRAILSTSSRRGIDGITLSVLPTPKVENPDDVVVQVRAVGFDIIDTNIARGYSHRLRHSLGLPKVSEPFVIGRECSGVVVGVGNQVQSVEINDRVWVYVPIWGSVGLMSEYVRIPEKYVALKPNNISFEGAATMPYAFVTLWNLIIEKSQYNPQEIKNKRVLIHFGNSSKNDGVGLLATQLFKSWGARVTISTEENKHLETNPSAGVVQMTFLHTLKSLGAESHIIIPTDHIQLSNLTQRLFDIVINTDSPHLSESLQNFCKNPSDEVLETFPADEVKGSNGIGSLLTSIIYFPYNLLFSRRFTGGIESPTQILNECSRLVESRMVVPVVAKSFLPSQYDQAFRHVANTSESALAQATVGKNVMIFNTTFR